MEEEEKQRIILIRHALYRMFPESTNEIEELFEQFKLFW